MDKAITASHVRLRRAYEAPAPDDDTRVLVDRLWPRGVSKANAAIDEWMKEVAPSASCDSGSAMIRSAGTSSSAVTGPSSGTIRTNSTACARLCGTAGSPWLVYATRDEDHNDAAVFGTLLLGKRMG